MFMVTSGSGPSFTKHTVRWLWVPACAEPVIGPAEGRTRWLGRDDDKVIHLSNREHVVVDLGDGVDAAQPHGGEELVADDVDGLGDAGCAAGAQTVNIGAADHAGSGAKRER